MPPLPPGLSEWFAPSAFLAGLTLLLGVQGKRIDELREDMKELRADLKASEARQQQEVKELRADLKASEARQQQEVKELRADMKEIRSDLKASEARQQQGMMELRAELKADNRVLAEKMDRLIEALLAVKQA